MKQDFLLIFEATTDVITKTINLGEVYRLKIKHISPVCMLTVDIDCQSVFYENPLPLFSKIRSIFGSNDPEFILMYET